MLNQIAHAQDRCCEKVRSLRFFLSINPIGQSYEILIPGNGIVLGILSMMLGLNRWSSIQ